jgi:plasmid stability protein
MASMTIRNLSDEIKQRLRIQAAEHGHSMEEEAREILRVALVKNNPRVNLAQSIRARFEPLGGVELDIPPREPMRDPPELG